MTNAGSRFMDVVIVVEVNFFLLEGADESFGVSVLPRTPSASYRNLNTVVWVRGHLVTTVDGLPVDFAIASADIDDREVLPLLCERGEYPILLGDKGYISDPLQQELLETENTCLLPTLRSNQKRQYPISFRKLHVRLRRRIETTINQLTEQFNAARVRAQTQWELQTRMSNKFGACLLGAFLNQCFGRPLMKLKDLVLA